jgi:hypothetical protein
LTNFGFFWLFPQPAARLLIGFRFFGGGACGYLQSALWISLCSDKEATYIESIEATDFLPMYFGVPFSLLSFGWHLDDLL